MDKLGITDPAARARWSEGYLTLCEHESSFNPNAINDWDKLCHQAYENLHPGGWLEFQEPMAWVESDDDSMDRAPTTKHWQQLCNDGAAQFGKIIKVGHLLKQRMLDAGFVDVHEKIVKVRPSRCSFAPSYSFR